MIPHTTNTVQLTGCIGRHTDVITIEDGLQRINCILSVEDQYINQCGERIKQTEWHHLIAWGKTAERLKVALKYGKEISVQGKLCHRAYTDKQGIINHFTEILVQKFSF